MAAVSAGRPTLTCGASRPKPPVAAAVRSALTLRLTFHTVASSDRGLVGHAACSAVLGGGGVCRVHVELCRWGQLLPEGNSCFPTLSVSLVHLSQNTPDIGTTLKSSWGYVMPQRAVGQCTLNQKECTSGIVPGRHQAPARPTKAYPGNMTCGYSTVHLATCAPSSQRTRHVLTHSV